MAYYDPILARRVFSMPRWAASTCISRRRKNTGMLSDHLGADKRERATGVTLHRVVEEIDGGDILAECEVHIAPDDTGLSLYNKCTAAGIALFRQALPELLSGQLAGRPQHPTPETRYHTREFPSHEIQFDGDAQVVLDRIRALHFPPFPAPYIKLGSKTLLIVEESEVRDPSRSDSFAVAAKKVACKHRTYDCGVPSRNRRCVRSPQ